MHFSRKILISNYFYYTVLILFSFNFFTNSAYANLSNNKNFCEHVDPENFISQKIPNKIIIKTENPKAWSKNIFSLFLELNAQKYKTDITNWYTFNIKNKYKKKFKSNIKFLFKDPDYECVSKAKVSVRGNLWWHLDWMNGYPFSSLRIDLENGHLNNLVKFNFLIPKSRQSTNGDINLELFITSLMNKIGLLAPKSYLVDVNINGNSRMYLFQEILSKEFLESRNLVEGPIFKGDHRFTTEQFPNKWKGDLGLAKIINTNYSLKNEKNKDLSFNALSALNSIYIDSATETVNHKKCDNAPVSMNRAGNSNKEIELSINQIYEAIIYASETEHSLTCDDRRFYYDPIREIFLPIYNDGKSLLNIDNLDISPFIKNSNVTNNSKFGADKALTLIEKIDEKLFFNELVKSGFSLDYEVFKKIKLKIVNNLNALKKTDLKEKTNLASNFFYDISSDFYGKEVKLLFLTSNNTLEICDFKLKNCIEKSISIKKNLIFESLLSQNFTKLKKTNILSFTNDYNYLFLSKEKNYDLSSRLIKRNDFFKEKITDNFYIEYNKYTNITIDKEKKFIKITLLNSKARIKIQDSFVDAWRIDIDGEKFYTENNNINYNNQLTGCLTFVDSEIKNVILNSNYSLCEDGYNFIRTKGSIVETNINNSLSDGLDFDFSNIDIINLNIDNAQNDCVDMSYGTYTIKESNVSNCGDKGISIGEKSNVSIFSSSIKYANVGIAAKDSSKVFIKNTNISNTKYCLAAYRKKQEFSGAYVKTDKIKCENSSKAFDIDGHSKLIKNNIIYQSKK